MIDTRRKVLFGLAGLALLIVLALGGYLLSQRLGNPYYGLTLWRETQMDDATRTLLEQRIATTQASIAAQQSGGELPEGTDMTDLYLSVANDAYVLGDLVTTREALEEVLNRNSLMHTAWNTYGSVLERMGDLAKAEAAFLQAIEIGPTSKYYMDYVAFLQKHYPERDEEVLTTLDHAVTVLGQRTEFMVALAQWYNDHSQCDESIAHYKVAVTLSPENTAIAEDLAMVRSTCVNAE